MPSLLLWHGERGQIKIILQTRKVGGEVPNPTKTIPSPTTPHLPEQMGQTGEGQVQWETLGGD